MSPSRKSVLDYERVEIAQRDILPSNNYSENCHMLIFSKHLRVFETCLKAYYSLSEYSEFASRTVTLRIIQTNTQFKAQRIFKCLYIFSYSIKYNFLIGIQKTIQLVISQCKICYRKRAETSQHIILLTVFILCSNLLFE